jgi:hypothetical protein
MIIRMFLSFHSSKQGTPLMPSLGEFYVKCVLTIFCDTHRVVYYDFHMRHPHCVV